MPQTPSLTVDKRNEHIKFKTPRPYGNSYDLNHYIAKKTDGTVFLSFSGGKDSVAAWLYMIECDCYKEIIPIFYYTVPHCKFTDDMLAYYEDWFQTPIIRMPSPNILSDWSMGQLLTPMCFRVVKSMRDYIFPCLFDDWDRWQRDDFKLKDSYTATGVRMHDGLNRRGVVMQHGGLKESEHKYMCIFDFTIADVLAIIKTHKIKLPADYHVWGKSFDGLDYRFILPLKKQYPKDYERVRAAYPLIDVNILRYRLEKAPLVIDDPEQYF